MSNTGLMILIVSSRQPEEVHIMMPDLQGSTPRSVGFAFLPKGTWGSCVATLGSVLANCALTRLGSLPRRRTGVFPPGAMSQFCLENTVVTHRPPDKSFLMDHSGTMWGRGHS